MFLPCSFESCVEPIELKLCTQLRNMAVGYAQMRFFENSKI